MVAAFQDALREHVESTAPFEPPGFEKVKSSTVRRVVRGSLGGTDVHVKLYRAVRLSDRARDAITGSPGIRELDNLLQARARGLPCVRPIAAGRFEGSFGTRSFLVTETVHNGVALPRGPLTAEDAERAGRLLRLAHDRGLRAHDLHPGNVLRTKDGELILLDLTSASFAEFLERDERLHALASFCLDLDGNLADPAARPFAVAYGATDDDIATALRVGRRLRNRALSAFGRRATRACRHTSVPRDVAPGERWFLHQSPTAQPLHAEARAFFDREPAPEPLASGRRGAVWLGEHLVVKARSAAAARRLFRAAYWLLRAGVPCAEPVALRLIDGRGYVFSRRIPAPNLAEELRAGDLDADLLRACARRLGVAVGRLHGFGLRNRDLKLENLVRDPGSDVLHVVDLEGVRRKAPLDTRGRAADLGRLYAAYRAAVDAVDGHVVRSFLRGYTRAQRCLQLKVSRNLLRRSVARSNEWARTHPSTRIEGSGSGGVSATSDGG